MTDVPAPAASLETLLAHREWVRRVARALARDDDDAGDIEQSAWLAAVVSPPKEPRAPRAWLATVLRRVTARSRRGEARRARREEAAARREATPSVEESVAEAESHERVVRAVLALPEPYRGTVVLRYFEDLAPREIAARTAVSADTVRTRLRRAKDLLRDALRDERGDFRAAIAPLLAERPRPPAAPDLAAPAGLSAAFVLKCVAAAALAAASVFAVQGALRGTSRDGTVTAQGETPASARADAAASEAASLSRRPRRADRAPSESGADEGDVSPAPGAMGEVAVLVERDGAPAADVLVVVHDHTVEVESGRTGADGRVRLALPAARLAGGLGLVLVPRDGAPGTSLVESDRETRVSLGSRAAVEGILRVDGAPPGESVALTLSWPAPRFDVSVAPQAVWDSLAKDGVTPTSITVACDAAGRFAFLAPMDEALDLGIDEHLQWSDYEAQAGRLRAPRTDLVLDAVRLPSMHGRVVDADGKTPLPGAELHVTFDEEGEGNGSMAVVRSADAKGRFDVAFPGPRARLLALTVAGPDGRGERAVELPESVPRLWDAGDVAIGRTRRVEFVVTGEGGAPVEAAVAFAESASSSPSVASDGEGRGSVLLPLTACRVRVAAPGFEVAVVDVQAGAADAVRVALVPGAQLVVTTPSVQGEMAVRVESDATMFTGPDGQFDEALAVAQSPLPFECSYGAGGKTIAVFHCGSSDPLAIDGLREHVRLRVSLVDALGVAVATAETELRAKERRAVELKPAREPRTVRGRVVLPGGGPAPGAAVRLAAGGADGDGVPVDLVADADGGFALEGVCAADVRALVQHAGAAPAVSLLTPAREESEAVVKLAPGRSVRVFVADESGQAVEDASVDALCTEFGDWGCGGVTVSAESLGRGVYELAGLPAGACVVRAAGGGGRGTAPAGAADAEVRVVVEKGVQPTDR